jgi:hypothetical protein
MISFPSCLKSSEGYFMDGKPVFVDPSQVIAVEPLVNRYHSYRPEQHYTRLHLATGGAVEVLAESKYVHEKLQAARENLRATRYALRDPESTSGPVT